MYHALKVFKLAPELHLAAGGYIWPIDRMVECGSDAYLDLPAAMMGFGAPFSPSKRSVSRPMSYYGDPSGDEELNMMRADSDSMHRANRN